MSRNGAFRRWLLLLSGALVCALLGAGIVLVTGVGFAQDGGAEVRITAMRHDDGRIEFALQERAGEGWSDRLLPRARFFPASGREGRWLVSTPLTVGVVEATAVSTPTVAPAATATHEATATVEPPPSALSLAGIVVAPENCDGYDRDHFASYNARSLRDRWDADDGAADGVITGWYTGLRLANSGQAVHVEHVVALKEAWCSGYREPSLGNWPTNLRPAQAALNLSKSDRDPAEWDRPDLPGWCRYLALHAQVKRQLGMTADRAELDYIARSWAAGCGDVVAAPAAERRHPSQRRRRHRRPERRIAGRSPPGRAGRSAGAWTVARTPTCTPLSVLSGCATAIATGSCATRSGPTAAPTTPRREPRPGGSATARRRPGDGAHFPQPRDLGVVDAVLGVTSSAWRAAYPVHCIPYMMPVSVT